MRNPRPYVIHRDGTISLRSDGAFIAACDPATITALVERIRELEAKAQTQAAQATEFELIAHSEAEKAKAATGRFAQIWRDGYYTGKRDYAGSLTGGASISTPNPHEGHR